MDKRTFVIIIVLTTVISYLVIRKYFKISPRYFLYAMTGLVVGLLIGTSIAWPLASILGDYGIVVAPYVLGIILLISVEFFIIWGKKIFDQIRENISKDPDTISIHTK